MKNYNNLIEVTKLINENLEKLEFLNIEKQKLIKLYNQDKNNKDTLAKIKQLENEYILLLDEAKKLNSLTKKLSA